MKTIRLITVFVLVLTISSVCISTARAELYKWKDDKGKLHFTDQLIKLPPEHKKKYQPYPGRSKKDKNPSPRTNEENIVRQTRADDKSLQIKRNDAYINSDYKLAAELIKQQISVRLKGAKSGDMDSAEDVRTYRRMLADIYAWYLGRPDDALRILADCAKSPLPDTEVKTILPVIEYMSMAEIYEHKRNHRKADKYYTKSLELITLSLDDKDMDELGIALLGTLEQFIKYRIDGLNLKQPASKNYKPMLPKLKLSYLVGGGPMFSIIMMKLSPSPVFNYSMFDDSMDEKKDLTVLLKNSPANISNMISSYALIVNSFADSVDSSDERTLRTFLKKYPDSYYALVMGYILYRYYDKNNMPEQKKWIKKELQEMAQRRNIEIIIEPDPRFSSPEKTWEAYREALIKGDLEGAVECFLLSERREYMNTFSLLGKEKMQEMGKNLGKLKGSDEGTSYREYIIYRMQKGMRMADSVIFYYTAEEWKMDSF